MADLRSPALILVVDDDLALLRLIEKSLRREGHQTATASSGAEAIQWLKTQRADLLLLDLDLPDMSGHQIVAELAKADRRVPFVVITGHGDERVAVKMMKQGALDYVVKDRDFLDFMPAVVLRSISQLDQQRKLAAAEEALRKEHAFTSAMIDTLGALVVVLDREGRIVRFNCAGEDITGYSFEEVKGRTVLEFLVPPAEAPSVQEVINQLQAGRFPNEFENHWITKTGELRLIAWSNTALTDATGAVEYIIATGIDITERKRLESEILEISGREQQRIGQDLHDGLSQHLAGIELMSQVLEQNLESKALPESVQAARIAQHVREAISQTRMLARGLSPVQLEAHGLMSALQELANTTRELFHVNCQFQCHHPVLVKDNTAATNLYRIAQEAINNAIKHGKAKEILIRLDSSGTSGSLSVADNGTGFFPDQITSNGLGLRIMNYRARMIGATLQILPRDGSGTIVLCKFRTDA